MVPARAVNDQIALAEVEERIAQETRTNFQGIASFQLKPAGESVDWGVGHVLLDQEGYDLAVGFVNIAKNQAYQFVARKAGNPWRGRVLDQRGRPVAGVLVQVDNWALMSSSLV